MQFGMIGLGRMGANLVRRLMRRGQYELIVFDRDPTTVRRLQEEGSVGSVSLEDLVARLRPPRTVWLMLPAGEATESVLARLAELMTSGDVIIDGGNSYWKDDIWRARELAAKGIDYVDVGTSGGLWGLERGYCLMIGGDAAVVERLDPIFSDLAPGIGTLARTPGRIGRDPRAEKGYVHAGPHGAGHFVKMVHNGIEYGLMQAYAEGFDILKNAASEALPQEQRLTFELTDIAEVWRRGSVISSWLLDLTAAALADDDELAGYAGFVQDSGEGRWTIMAALEEAVPADVLATALYTRFRSRQTHTFAEKLLSAMREGFGGHTEPKGGRS
jgi:6-phosphogluconate dehydrogenase